MGLREIYEEGYPSLVVKLEYDAVDIDGLREYLYQRAGERELEEMTLGNLVAWLSALAPPKRVAVSASFAPVDWASPASWGEYSWPYQALASHGLDKVRGFYVRVDPGGFLSKALLGLYKGFGVAVMDRRVVMGDTIEEEARPLLVFIDARREPKDNAVFVLTEGDETLYSGLILFSRPDAIEALRGLGFEGPDVLEPAPGVRVYAMRPPRGFASKREAREFLGRVEEALARLGISVFMHDAASGGLPYLVREKIGV